jgi:triosephosphate isomerase
MKYVYVANWKMYLSVDQEVNFCKKNYDALCKLQTQNNCTIIICPSFVALAPLIELLQKTTISIGAQNCSDHQLGAYTGEVSAQSLAEIGATYCIVGHSEQRHYQHETDDMIAAKTVLLLQHKIMPIICIGETKKESNLAHQTQTVLMQQLEPLFAALRKSTHQNGSITIAYEPVWAIGTGIIPQHDYLEAVFEWLQKTMTTHLPTTKVTLLYGGSVDLITIMQLKKIPTIAGFLIGKASTDFEQFTKIIQSNNS